MYLIGTLALLSAFVTNLLTILVALTAIIRKKAAGVTLLITLIRFTFGGVVLASAALWYLLLADDFHVEYVASHSSRDLPEYFKLSAFWAGQSGSLLLWSLLLTLMIVISVRWLYKSRYSDLPHYIVITAFAQLFFLTLNIWAASPFALLEQVYPDGTVLPFFPADGKGMNPLLQHPAMVIHPPLLFAGYSGFLIPAGLAVASLLSGDYNGKWIYPARIWSLLSWLFLSAGIMLGAWWAYAELGWGGYWAWDPVENASLLPWLTATAFLHSAIAQTQRNRFRIWNIVLTVLTYLLCLLATYITRSGVVSSVHAFAENPLGYYFLVFISLTTVFIIALILSRKKHLSHRESPVPLISRESAFLFNNLVLVFLTIAIAYGTLFPTLYELFTGRVMTLGKEYFLSVSLPLALLLLFLIGCGIRLSWEINPVKDILKKFRFPLLAGLVTGLMTLLVIRTSFIIHGLYALSAFMFVIIGQEVYATIGVFFKSSNRSFQSLLKILSHERAKLGSHLSHLGLMLIFIGISGGYFNEQATVQGKAGERLHFSGYELEINSVTFDQTRQYESLKVRLSLYEHNRFIAQLIPESRFYSSSQQYSSEIDWFSNLSKDIYVVLSEYHPEDQSLILHVFINPLVKWIWIGTIILITGGIMALRSPIKCTNPSAESAS